MRNHRSYHQVFPLVTALAACSASLAACSASPAATDASTDASETAPTDAPAVDRPSSDAPTSDVPASSDVPAASDVPASSDVPDARADVPTDAPPDGPLPTAPMRVAYVAPDADHHPVVWVQRPDGTERRALHFTGITDDNLEQDERVPPVVDGRVVSVHHLAWSPDGEHLAAVVSTAIDQSEVVVLDVARGGGYVASANGQYVMPALDWSPDGRRLAFVMSTQPHALGLELVVSDLPAHRWRFATDRASLRGASIRVRFDATGAAVTWSRIDREEETAPWNYHSSLHRLVLTTTTPTDVATDVVGRIDGMRRDNAVAYVVRTLRASADGVHESALLARTLASGAESTLMPGDVGTAAQGPFDGALLVGGSGVPYRVLRAGEDDVRVDVPRDAESAALWAPAAR